MEAKCSAAAQAWLARHTRWRDGDRRALAALAPDLLRLAPAHGGRLLGIGGPPGTGKSTLARLLTHLLSAGMGKEDEASAASTGAVPTRVLSLDDYYLPRRERTALARSVHPLLARRGVPGTHDTTRLLYDLDRLLAGHEGVLALPRFDKGRDDRSDAVTRVRGDGRPAFVVLEGWFVGTPPQTASALAIPVNDLERTADPDGAWRAWVNGRLEAFHGALAARGAETWHLAAPDWNAVLDWRWRQERDLAPEHRGLRDPDAVADFLAPFERLCRHQFDGAASWAHQVIRLDRRHRPHLQCPP